MADPGGAGQLDLLGRVRRIDVAHTQAALADLPRQREVHLEVLADYGLVSTKIDTVPEKEAFAQALITLGLRVAKTETGQWALSKTALGEVLRGATPAQRRLIEAFHRCREIDKTGPDYLAKFLALRDAHDRLHPVINALGAQTGRMSISDPPLQQIPRAGDARSCLRAEPGHALVTADFAQIEFRVAAALADEPTMKANICAGIDLHDVTARRLFGDGFTDAQRGIAKGAGFGRLYGAGAATVAANAGVDLAVAQRALSAFDAEYPGIARFADHVSRLGEIITPLGRRLPLDHDRSYIGINYYIQSTARDIFVQALFRLVAAGLMDHLWLPVHDEIIVSVPEQDRRERDDRAGAQADQRVGAPR